MGGHREIDHTADLGFEVWAGSLEELFSEATAALSELCYDRTRVRPAEQRSVCVSGRGIEELLVQWLQEVYFQLESDAWLAAVASEVHCRSDRVDGVLVGEPFDPARHTLHTEIKAITYHGMHVEEGDDGLWRTLVIVDV